MRLFARAILAAAGVVSLVGTATAPASASTNTPYVIVALGDSYASGEGLYVGASPQNAGSWLTRGNHPAPHDDGCHRSPYGYPAVVARWLPTRLHRSVVLRYLACSGATTADLWAAPGRSSLLAGPEHLEAPQITPRALRGANLVTITIGGNDVGFVSILGICELEPAVCTGMPGAGLAATLSHRIDALRPTLTATYRQVQRLAPRALVEVVEYPDLFPTSSATSCQGLPASTISAFHAAEVHLATVISSSAQAAGVRVVDPNSSGHFRGRSVCSAHSLFGGLNSTYLGAAFHPTRQGQADIAQSVERAITG